MRSFVLSFLESSPAAPSSLLSSAVQLITALVWPIVLVAFLLTQRQVIGRLLTALALLAESANKIKVWQIEIERSIDQEVDKAAKSAQGVPSEKASVPKSDVLAAARVETLVGKLADSQSSLSVLKSVRLRMVALAEQYDEIRERMTSGPERTSAMKAIVAQMRTLAIAARGLLKEFSEFENSAGIRLCAVAILQMAPSGAYLDWLGKRFSAEQPFVFYQAAIALREATKTLEAEFKPELMRILTRSLEILRSFQGGFPDQSSIHILEDTLRLLQSPRADIKQSYPN